MPDSPEVVHTTKIVQGEIRRSLREVAVFDGLDPWAAGRVHKEAIMVAQVRLIMLFRALRFKNEYDILPALFKQLGLVDKWINKVGPPIYNEEEFKKK